MKILQKHREYGLLTIRSVFPLHYSDKLQWAIFINIISITSFIHENTKPCVPSARSLHGKPAESLGKVAYSFPLICVILLDGVAAAMMPAYSAASHIRKAFDIAGNVRQRSKGDSHSLAIHEALTLPTPPGHFYQTLILRKNLPTLPKHRAIATAQTLAASAYKKRGSHASKSLG